MDLRELASVSLFLLLTLCLSAVDALKCKCTQSSWKTTCENGICEVAEDSGACLMLDHPVSGRHYACSQSSARDEECIEKITKTGAKVTVCSCDSSDYCNFKMWPSKVAMASSQESEKVAVTVSAAGGVARFVSPALSLLSLPLLKLLA